jgi:hypothetical protein
LVPILSQMNPLHAFPPYFLKIHSNITLPSTPRSSEWCLPFKFSDQNFVYISHLSHPYHTSQKSHPSKIYHLNNIL